MPAPRRKKILIADDDLVLLKVLSLKLSSQGFDVVKVHDGGMVTRRIAEEHPDVVLLDFDFGPLATVGHITWDGVKMLEWIARLEDLAAIPIIVITADESKELHERCRCAGATAVKTKPVDFESLVAEIRRVTEAPADPSTAKP